MPDHFRAGTQAPGKRPLLKSGCLFVVCAVVLSGCAPPEEKDVVARVGTRTLTRDELERRIPIQLSGRLPSQDLRRLVDGWVEEELLFQEALAKELHEDPLVSARIEQMRRKLLTAELLEREMAAAAEVDDASIQAFYAGHQDDFLRDQTEIRVRHILVADRTDMTRVRRRIDRGELFDQVAREESIDESAERGGDLGYFTEDRVDPDFWSASVKATPNRSTQVRTRMGYHLVEVLDRREAGVVRDLLEVKAEIRQRILAERRETLRDSLMDAIRRRLPAVVHDAELSSDI